MKIAKLSPRLASAADFVRWGAVLADVGTDHAHLPLFLLETGKIKRAVCTDVNKGPLDSAKRNAKELGLSDKIDFILTDGAGALAGLGVTDVSICGMGGELISDIIERATHLKNENIRLILQPMSKQAHLRSYLAENGFRIIEEKYTQEQHHAYVTILAAYSGEKYEISEVEAQIGKLPLDFCDTARIKYINSRIASLARAVGGKGKSSNTENPEAQLLEKIREIMKGESK